MVGLYVATEALSIFGDAALPVQHSLAVLFLVATLPAGLVIIPLWFGLSIATGNVFFLGDEVPYLTEAVLAVAVLLNAVFVNWVAGRPQRRERAV
jgi:hypothetical protein